MQGRTVQDKQILQDMDPAYIVGDYTEHTQSYFDGSSRKILVTNVEAPYPDGRLIVSCTDTEGYITHVNQSFVDMSGYTEEELLGAPHHILRHPDLPPAAFADLWQTLGEGKRWQGYVKNLRKDGGYYWVFATAIPNVRDGKVVGYSSVRRKPSLKKVQECIELYPTLF